MTRMLVLCWNELLVVHARCCRKKITRVFEGSGNVSRVGSVPVRPVRVDNSLARPGPNGPDRTGPDP